MALAPLPIDPFLPELAAAVTGHGAAVLRAPTGSGKTTRVPPALAAAGCAGRGRVVVLEPRRIAARAAAGRIAEERGWRLGREVGYQVRFDRRAGADTRVLFVTEGMMVRMLQDDPFLDGVGLVVFDEFHERGLEADLALGMVQRLRGEVRDDLRVLVTSATLDPAPVADFLGGCPRIEAPGRLHPVAVRHARRPLARDPRGLHAEIARELPPAVRELLAETAGDLLVFLPGVGEIRAAEEALAALGRERDLAVVRLHGSLSLDEQNAALRPLPRRKVILATNVAESSVTVEGVTGVVDTGLARRMRHDLASGINRLELTRISRASADQRAGRAGRTAPGVCLRLWPEIEHAALPDSDPPEVERLELSGALLELLAWGEGEPEAFPWLDPPAPEALAAAGELLRRLGATGEAGLTSLGRVLARLPVHPRLGRLLVEGERYGHGREAALLAALLAERPPFLPGGPRDGPHRASRSDVLDRLDALEAFERRGADWHPTAGRVNRGAARFVLESRDQLARLLREAGAHGDRGPRPEREEALLRALFVSHSDRLVRRREPGSLQGVMVGGRGVRLARESGVVAAELFVAVDLDAGRPGERSEALVRLASAVERNWLPEERVSREDEVVFDPERERVVAHRVTRYEDLELDRREIPAPGGDAARVLAEAAAADPERALGLAAPDVASLLDRVRFLRRWRPELELPDLDAELRGARLAALVAGAAGGARSFADLRRLPWANLLRGSLAYRQLETLDREAPERIEVPSGSRVRLRYRAEEPPVLAVRIQEVFGLAETPTVAGGRVPVLLHLLAPNMRPQQVTNDLGSFWANTYPAVRKELAGRYPKHAWPEEPRTARPERRPGRRR